MSVDARLITEVGASLPPYNILPVWAIESFDANASAASPRSNLPAFSSQQASPRLRSYEEL